IRSERSPLPTWLLRSAARAASRACRSNSYSRARKTFIARALFLCCDFSSCWITTSPVGRCVIRTALSVVLTDCPPGPLERNTSMRKSLSSILISTSSASGSTATVAAEVWMRPLASVSGTRWTRCTPDSNLRRGEKVRAGVEAAPPLVSGHRRARVPAELNFGGGKAVGAGDGGARFFNPADAGLRQVEHFEAPAAQSRVALVHPEQIGREQCRLVAAGAGSDFE